ncbi:MAG: hypothetical protein MI919_11390 [Holophagales bacterium]|nr:hypothetical protein [Holophagales bacterium]
MDAGAPERLEHSVEGLLRQRIPALAGDADGAARRLDGAVDGGFSAPSACARRRGSEHRVSR